MLDLRTPLAEVNGIGQGFISKLKRLNISTVGDLLSHFPTRYEDFSQIYKIADLIPNQEATIQGRVEEIEGRRAWRRNLYIVECLITDDTGSIKAVWFNQPYIKNVLQPGRLANFSGKVTGRDEIHLSNPTYELIREQGTRDERRETTHTGRIVGVYPETRGLTSKGIRYLVKPILENLKRVPEPLPEEILKDQNLPDVNRALKQIHFPDELENAMKARKRFAFEDLFLLQLYNLKQKIALARQEAPPVGADIPFVKDLLKHLPFTLTLSQKKSLWEILKDMSRNQPMNRLLQGDVGSGKTVIAAIAALNAAHGGFQAALMAPTEILARQHYQTFLRFFPGFEGGVALVTASQALVFYGHGLTAETKKKQVQEDIKNGKIKIAIGTHSLIQKSVNFRSLALVVIDEQHRFGVNQRASLTDKKTQGAIPHFLSMSATPIPRTLSLTIFGDLDLSIITEMPKNRKTIVTKSVDVKERTNTYQFIREEIKRGRQAFVVCPRIEPNEKTETTLSRFEWQKLELKSVKEEYDKLSKKIFPDLKILMLHGKMKAAEKEKIMRDFLEKRGDVLVTTSVVEVGVDVPNATIMFIEGADRFGLAQLYQFRGRVGRGENQSYCFLFTDSSSQSTKQRLKSIVEAKNGFELAEKDLKLRGPGEFFGQAQTGMPDVAMQAIQNPEMVKETRDAAVTIIKSDPNLKKHQLLGERVAEFQRQIHWE
ncbi:MAG: ATP-dependent DNA helicase RecG [Minisyncoccia bacterium]|jgi:ATP-dependent DNA helicase RecG